MIDEETAHLNLSMIWISQNLKEQLEAMSTCLVPTLIFAQAAVH